MVITFCGHSVIKEVEKVREKLMAAIENIFDSAEKRGEKLLFYNGGYGDFDMLAAKAVNAVRKRYTDIECENIFVTAYILPSHQNRNEFMLEKFDDIVYPPIETVPYRYAILRRNEWMADTADIVISYIRYTWGGAFKMQSYAKRRHKNIIEL